MLKATIYFKDGSETVIDNVEFTNVKPDGSLIIKEDCPWHGFWTVEKDAWKAIEEVTVTQA